MTISRLLGIALSASIMTACSGSGGGSGGGGDVAVKPTDVGSHKAQECPSFDGEYTKDDAYINVKTTVVENGIQLNDSDVNWTVDGKSHVAEGSENLSYIAICSQKTISMDLSQGSTLLGNLQYSSNDQGQLVIETKAIDSRMGKSGKEVWNKKTK